MPFQKRKVLMNAFVTSQFSYCPLTWMFHSRKPNNKINRLHERCLPVVYFNCKFILSIVFLSTINKRNKKKMRMVGVNGFTGSRWESDVR